MKVKKFFGDLSKRIKNFIVTLLKIGNRPEMKILPGNLAFYMVTSIVPIILLLLFVASKFSLSLSGLLKLFEGTVPDSVIKILDPFFHSNLGISGGISMIFGFIMVADGANSIILGTNLMYKIDDKNIIKRRIKSFFLAIIIIFIVLIMVIIMGIGNIILKALIKIEIINGLGISIYTWYSILKWPAAFILLFVSLKTIYTIALDDKQPSKSMNKGALFGAIMFLIATALYTWYTTSIVDYTIFYGPLASFIVLLLWIYLLSYIMLLGIGINANDYFMNKKDNCDNNKK